MRSLLFTSLLLTACAPNGPSGDSQAAITGGSSDSGDEAVALVHGAASSSYEVCTASFLTPSVLLTAAHCVEDDSRTYTIGPNESYSFSGSIAPTLYAVSSIAIDPSYSGGSAPRSHDLAILHLSDDVGDSTLAFHTGAPDSSWDGASIHIVGYGRSSASTSDENTRRSVDTTIGSYTSTQLVISNGKQDCVGDSGGPAIMRIDGEQTIVGVASAATDDCKTTGYYGRIDSAASFIDGQIASSGSTGGGSTGGTTGGVQTAGCSAAGAPSGDASIVLAMIALLFALRSRTSDEAAR